MTLKNQLARVLGLFALALLMVSCSKPQDLDTPCPDYGKTCSQTLIN